MNLTLRDFLLMEREKLFDGKSFIAEAALNLCEKNLDEKFYFLFLNGRKSSLKFFERGKS